MAQFLTIATKGNPILQQISQSIDHLADPNLQRLIDDLIQTAIQQNGVGIAAPQVSQSLRLFIVAPHLNSRYPNVLTMPPTAMINPKLIHHSTEKVKDWEGCLSIPDLRGLVPRYQHITVEYLDRYGQIHQSILKDFVARIFQHELDHLDGILFIDRLESNTDLYTEEMYQKIRDSV